MPFVKLIAIGSLALLTGCDPGYFVRRDNRSLNDPAPIDCIKSAIDQLPGNKITRDDITHHPFVCGRGLHAHRIDYSTDAGTISLEACYEGQRLKSFHQCIGGIPTKANMEKVSRILAKMRDSEQAIESRCGIEGFVSGMKNDCVIAECEP